MAGNFPTYLASVVPNLNALYCFEYNDLVDLEKIRKENNFRRSPTLRANISIDQTIRKIAANFKKSISLKRCSLVGQLVLRVAMKLVASNTV